MGVEIERNFLVDTDVWLRAGPQKSILIRQAYLVKEPHILLRVRIADNRGYITIKGKISGISRPEFEYEIPLIDANQLVKDFAKTVVEKVRHYIMHDGKTWMVDEFKGLNEGLITAEIELESPEECITIPEWIKEEVTLDYRYLSSNLADKPYQTWGN